MSRAPATHSACKSLDLPQVVGFSFGAVGDMAKGMVVWTIRRGELADGSAAMPTVRFFEHISATAIVFQILDRLIWIG